LNFLHNPWFFSLELRLGFGINHLHFIHGCILLDNAVAVAVTGFSKQKIEELLVEFIKKLINLVKI
jgi:hypothetical protein